MKLDLISKVKDIKYKGIRPFEKKKVIKKLNEAIDKVNDVIKNKYIIADFVNEKHGDKPNFKELSYGRAIERNVAQYLQTESVEFIYDITGEKGYRNSISNEMRRDAFILLGIRFREFYFKVTNLIKYISTNGAITLNNKSKQIQEIDALINYYLNFKKHFNDLKQQYKPYILSETRYNKFQNRKYEQLKSRLGTIINSIKRRYPDIAKPDNKYEIKVYQQPPLAKAFKPDAYSFYNAINAAYKIVSGDNSIKITASQQNLIYWLLTKIDSTRSIETDELPATNLNQISDKTTKYTMISLMNAEVEVATKWEKFCANMLEKPKKPKKPKK